MSRFQDKVVLVTGGTSGIGREAAKAFAREAAPLGITANVVAPGLIDTEMLRSTVTSSGALEAAAQAIPLGRIGQVPDVAAAVAYLVSPSAAYLTGVVIDVNGGYRMP